MYRSELPGHEGRPRAVFAQEPWPSLPPCLLGGPQNVPLVQEKAKQPQAISTPRADASTYTVNGGWGDRIEWFNPQDGLKRVVGWKTPKPQEGDVLTCEMQSGKTGVWLFQKIDHAHGVNDMFFADVLPVGYAGEIAFDLPPPPKHPLADLMRFSARAT